jgi:GTPase
MTEAFRSGYVALAGRPNVGKSSLLNAVLGRKIAIVAHRRQTTRNRILGVRTTASCQMIFLDTPGVHAPDHALGRAMVRTAGDALKDVDVVLFVTDSERPGEEDSLVLELLRTLDKPVLFVLNKADRKSPAVISGAMLAYESSFPFSAFLSVSALKGKGIGLLVERVRELLPAGPRYYDEETVTDQYERFMAAEIIREKIIKNTSEEVPHAVAVLIGEWREKKAGLVVINAEVYVERAGQKGIIIGKGGEMLKKIGSQARKDIEALIDAKVFLDIRVKVKKGWRDDGKMLKELGYV